MPAIVGLISDSHSRWERTKRAIEALQANDDYQEYQVATKFASAMDSVLRGAA